MHKKYYTIIVNRWSRKELLFNIFNGALLWKFVGLRGINVENFLSKRAAERNDYKLARRRETKSGTARIASSAIQLILLGISI